MLILRLASREQRAVIQVGPPALVHTVHLMARQECPKIDRQIGIQDDAHGGSVRDLGGRRTLDQRLLRQLQHGYGVVARHAGKLIQELIQRVTRLEIIDEALHRHPGAGEDGGSPETIR